jgi:folate-binding protein YgfZ
MPHLSHLPARGVIAVAGADRVAFLQGLVSNDVTHVAPGRAVWAALLTPQGKYLADFFILDAGDALLLDCAAAHVALVVQKLTRFRLRAQVTVNDASPCWHVYAAWPAAPADLGEAIAAPDPRLSDAGWRILSPHLLTANASSADWNAHRLALGLPDGVSDLEPDKSVLLEAGFDELHGVSWTKGCYMGQELTARTKYRGLIKRRLLPVQFVAPLPPPGTPILADGREAGTLRSGQGANALATLRLDALDAPLTCDGKTLRVIRPAWLVLPAAQNVPLPPPPPLPSSQAPP